MRSMRALEALAVLAVDARGDDRYARDVCWARGRQYSHGAAAFHFSTSFASFRFSSGGS